ncbi:MAG: CRTAC1 family protein [Gemmatimonadota bacterium]
MTRASLLVPVVLLSVGCSSPREPSQSRPPAAPPEAAPALAAQFVEVAGPAGIDFRRVNGVTPKKYFPETMGGGGMFWDYDGDGWLDVYLVDGSYLGGRPDGAQVPANALYRGRGDGTFERVAGAAGAADTTYGNGCAAGDYDGDGDLDLFVANYGPNRFYRNDGGAFADRTDAEGLGDARWSTSSAFTDFDRDGDLDLYVANYVQYELAMANRETMPYLQVSDAAKFTGVAKGYPHPANFAWATDVLYRNEGALGARRFRDVTRAAGVYKEGGRSLGVVAADFDGDGWPDIYVANDAVVNFLFLNNGDGTFRETGVTAGVAYGQDGQREAGMGVDVGDYDRDGDLDLTVCNFQGEPNALYSNQGNGFFLAHAYSAGIGLASLPFLCFGTNFLDFDSDGLLDLFAASGHVLDNVAAFDQSTTYPQRNLLFHNEGPNQYGNYSFSEVGLVAGPGFRLERVGRGSATGDYDNDGDVDILVVNVSGPVDLLRNDGGNRAHWLSLRARTGPGGRDAIGARVRVVAAGHTQTGEVRGSGSYLSQSDLRLHFGLGPAAAADSLQIRWPSGRVDSCTGLGANQFIEVREGQGCRALP